MNKIYKVIWSKARSCYVAVSELANAHSKGSKGARALLASALLLGAGLMPLFTTELEAAYTATGTSKGQYTVYQTDASADKTTTQTWDGKEYTYTKQTLTNPENSEKVYVYVRNGYTAALVEGKRFSSAEVNYKIMAYQTDMSANTAAGLLYTDTVNGTIGSETLTEGGIKDVAVTMYTGGVIGEDDTPYNWNYYIQDTDGTWVDGGSMGKNRFVTVTANEQGMYTYNGELLENSYIYVLKKNKTYQIGVFVNDKGHLYKGNVYGKHNEILKTAVDENNNIYSFWGAENDDPNVLLSQSNMTIGELNSALGALVTNVRTAQGDDIQKVTASQTTGKENSGTISLMRRGQYDATTGKYTGDYAVDGTLQLTSDGGTKGEDVTLHVQQAGTDGTYADAFTLAAGSKVEALGDEGATLAEGGTVKKLKINGISYNLAQDTGTTYTAGDNITISDDNKISAKDTTLSTATKTTDTDGAVTWTITDTDNNSVTLDDLASHTDLSNLTTTVNTKYTTLSNNDIKSGSIGTDGKVTLTKNDDTTIEVGTVQDYSVTSGTYNSEGKKITLTKKNAYSEATDTVDIDLTALENKMGNLTNITTEGKTQITNLIDVQAGDNITSVTSTTDANGVKTFTVNAKDTTYTAGDDTITVDATNHTIKANSSTIIQNAQTDIQTIAKGAVKVAAGTNVTLGEGTDATGAKVYTINAKDTTYTAGDNITIDTDNKISAKDTTLSKAEKSGGTNSAVTWTITDTDGKSVELTDLASYTDLSALSSTVNTKYTTLSNNDIKSGSIGTDGKVTLTKKDDTTIEVGTVKDYSVTSGAYDSANKKITLTKKNAYGGATSTVDIDLTDLEKKISDSSSTIDKGFSLIGTATGSAATTKKLGEAITVGGANGIVVSSTDGEDGKVIVSLDSTITVGKADKKGEDGKPGEAGEQGHISLAGKDGTNGKDGTTLVDIRAEKGDPGLNGTDGITRIIYEDGTGPHQVATLDDGLKFQGDDSTVISKKLNKTMEIKGGADTSTLTDNNIGVISDGEVLRVKLANALNDITSITGNGTTISLNSGNVTINGGLKVSGQINGVTAGTLDTDAVNVSQLKEAKADISTLDKGAVKYDKNGDTYDYSKVTMGGTTYATDEEDTHSGGTTITNVSYATVTDKTAAGYDGSQAVNMDRLNDSIDAAKTDLTNKGFSLLGTADGSKATTKNLGESITVGGANGIVVSSTDGEDGKVTVSLDSNITIGKAGKKGEDGKPGEAGEQGHIGLAGKDGTNGKDGTTLVDIRTETGMGFDGKDGKDGITRIIYEDGTGDHQVATLDDGLKFQGDDSTVISRKLNQTLTIKGGVTDTSKLTEGNIGVISDGEEGLKVELANALTNITSIANGDTSITLNNGVTIKGGEVNVSNNKITNVAKGENESDAVNKGQLDEVENKITTLDSGAVKYDKNGDTYDYSKVTMGGAAGTVYSADTKTGGTTITNVSYATVTDKTADGYDGSQAVNMDRLNDSIDAAMEQVKTDVAKSDIHVKAGNYEIAADGKVTMDLVKGEDGTASVGTVVIKDVAKASDIGSLNGGGHTTDGDGILKDELRNSVTDEDGNVTYTQTTVVDAINKVDTKVENLETKVENYQNTTNEKLTKIEQSIVDANANHTALTVNGGTAAGTGESYSDGNLKLNVETKNGKSTYDVKLSDKIVLGDEKSGITLDGTKGEATISKKLTVGDSESGITMQKLDLGTYTKDVGDHKKGDAMGEGYVVTGLGNTTTHYENFANGDGKAATEEQLKEALGAMDFQATDTKGGETVNKYNIVNNATNVTEAIYAIDQNLTDANARIENNAINIQNLSGSLGKLNTRVNRVGAGAAALAALHPLDFDPDDKWDFAAGYGNYAGANATSIGAYYRPNEDTMFSVAGSFGGGENMVNAGVSFKLGQGNHVTTSRVAMAKEIKALRATVEEQSEQNAALSATVEAQGKQIAALTALVEKLTGEKVETPDAEKKDA